MRARPAYMSPEQARGKTLDKRTDIWAFGCVLYEILTGRPAFGGETSSDTIAAILEHEPDWSALPAQTPPDIQRLLQRCLEKDPEAACARYRRRAHRNRGSARGQLSSHATALPNRASGDRQKTRPCAAHGSCGGAGGVAALLALGIAGAVTWQAAAIGVPSGGIRWRARRLRG